MNPRRWPVHDQVDYLAAARRDGRRRLRASRAARASVNPGYYAEQAIDGVAGELSGTVPYTAPCATRSSPPSTAPAPIVAQGPKTIVLAERGPRDGQRGAAPPQGHPGEVRGRREAVRAALPRGHRARLAASADKAAAALERYAKWIESNLGEMKGKASVGRRSMEWYFKRVNFVPWSRRRDCCTCGEIEKNRFLMSIAIEEKKQPAREAAHDAHDRGVDRVVPAHLPADEVLAQGPRPHQLPSICRRVVPRARHLAGAVRWHRQPPRAARVPDRGRAEPGKRLFVVPEDHWFTKTYWERTMRLDPITDYQHSDWPGHYFEGEVTRRNPCPIRAVHRDTGFSQGWAHYWEEFFLDMGYPYLRGPRTRELTYNFLLLRAVRVPLDIDLSNGTMSMEEAIKYQIDRVPSMEDHISRAEVEMYARWPYQATSYIVGKKQIEQILAERIAKGGNKTIDWRAFHDAMLSSGQIPPALVRWEMTGNDDQMKAFWDAAPLAARP